MNSYEEFHVKSRGIEIGNKVKLKNGDIDSIRNINPSEPDYPIRLWGRFTPHC